MSESERDYIARRNQEIHSGYHGGLARAMLEHQAIQRAPSRRDSVVSALTAVLARGARDFPDVLGSLPAFKDVVRLAEKIVDEVL
jgi:hypothetical protein